MGNEVTLVNSDCVWERLVIDAKARGCFHNADEDESLAEAITAALVELDQVGNLLNMDSLLFRKAKWKVCCFSLLCSEYALDSTLSLALINNNKLYWKEDKPKEHRV